jgi:hypothetical protein
MKRSSCGFAGWQSTELDSAANAYHPRSYDRERTWQFVATVCEEFSDNRSFGRSREAKQACENDSVVHPALSEYEFAKVLISRQQQHALTICLPQDLVIGDTRRELGRVDHVVSSLPQTVYD